MIVDGRAVEASAVMQVAHLMALEPELLQRVEVLITLKP